ncbi:MAG: CHAP domain-containing protein [Candidatus Paceibacterota bacterium]
MIKLIIILLLISLSLFSQVKYELPCNKDLLEKSHELAISQIGVTELTGKNDGYEIDKYQIAAGYWRGCQYPYCAAGQYWCFSEAAKLLNFCNCMIPIYRTGSTYLMFNKAKQVGKKVSYKPQKNDLLFWIVTTTGHVERIDSVLKSGWVKTIGFNTSSGTGNQRDGEGVYLRKRNIYHILSRMKVRGLIGFKTYE